MKFAVLGLGFMGSTHLKALRAIPGVEVAAVCSLDERALSGDLTAIQGNIGGPGERLDFSRAGKYREPERALDHPDIDAVDICLPTHLHGPIAIQALRAGKHVLVEKPMALDGSTGVVGTTPRAMYDVAAPSAMPVTRPSNLLRATLAAVMMLSKAGE